MYPGQRPEEFIGIKKPACGRILAPVREVHVGGTHPMLLRYIEEDCIAGTLASANIWISAREARAEA